MMSNLTTQTDTERKLLLEVRQAQGRRFPTTLVITITDGLVVVRRAVVVGSEDDKRSRSRGRLTRYE